MSKFRKNHKNIKLKFPTFLIIVPIIYIIVLIIIGLFFNYCKYIQLYLNQLLEIPYFKSFIKLSLPILTPVITIIGTWTMYQNDKKAKQKEDEKIKKENVRPFFFILEKNNSKYLEFKIPKPNSIILKSELFYIGYDECCNKKIEFRTLDSRFSYNLTKTENDELRFTSSLYIIIKSLTTCKELVYYIYINDSSLDENFVKTENKKRLFYEPYYTYPDNKDSSILNLTQEKISSLIEIVDHSEFNQESIRFKNDFHNECYHTIEVLKKSRSNPMNELYRIIALIRYYTDEFDYEIIIKLLEILAKAMQKSKLKKAYEVTMNKYFAGNMIYNDIFCLTYKQKFNEAAIIKKAIQPAEMVVYLKEYIKIMEDNYSNNRKTDTDFLLRNIEVYLRDDIDIDKNEDILFNIILLLEECIKKYSVQK